LAVPSASGPVFRCSPPGHVFGGAETVGSRFHILRSWTLFHVFGGAETVGSRFQVFPSRTCFWRCGDRRVPFSCFVHPEPFSTVTRASGLVFMFCAPRTVFGGTDGVESRFHVLCTLFRFWRYRGRRVPFSCYARPEPFSPVSRVWGPVFMFCSPRFIFGGTEGVGSHFHVLRARTRFRRYRGRPVSISCFALPDSFSAVPWASVLVFTFCAPRFIFGGTESVGSCFHVLHSRTHIRLRRVHRVPFS
jgi:hypothetical protein